MRWMLGSGNSQQHGTTPEEKYVVILSNSSLFWGQQFISPFYFLPVQTIEMRSLANAISQKIGQKQLSGRWSCFF